MKLIQVRSPYYHMDPDNDPSKSSLPSISGSTLTVNVTDRRKQEINFTKNQELFAEVVAMPLMVDAQTNYRA